MAAATIADVKAAIAAAAPVPFGAALRLDCGEDGAFSVDGRKAPTRLSDSLPAACTLYAEPSVFLDVFSGETDLGAAFLAGKIAVAGDLSVLARLEIGGDD